LALWDAYYAKRKAQDLAGKPTSTYSGGSVDYNAAYDERYLEEHGYGSQWGYTGMASGGLGIYNKRGNVPVAEYGPEMVAAIPLSSMSRSTYDINLNGGIDVSGVSPSMERDISGAVMDILKQFGQQLLKRQFAGVS